jgi:hypothetical protein
VVYILSVLLQGNKLKMQQYISTGSDKLICEATELDSLCPELRKWLKKAGVNILQIAGASAPEEFCRS